MILTVCPSPCIDCTVELDALNVGKLNRIENKVLTYGGKALNVAVGISRLGGKAVATGFMPQKERGQFIHSLEAECVGADFIETPGSVRINYKIIDKKSMMTEINDRGPEVPEKKQRELIDLVEKLAPSASVVVMSGSLPRGVDDGFYTKLLERIPGNVLTMADCGGEILKKIVEKGVYLIKPNLEEFEELTGKTYDGIADMAEAAKNLAGKKVKNILLSLGKDGAVFTDGNIKLYCRSANVAVNSTVGAGDCMLAAAALMTERNEDSSVILRCAVAAGTASITTPGSNLFKKDEYEEIYDRIFVEKLP